MKTVGLIPIVATLLGGCAPEPRQQDPLDLLGDVVRVVRLAESELRIWNEEVEPLRPLLETEPDALRIYLVRKPSLQDIQAIRERTELLISSLPRQTPETLLRSLSEDLERANHAVSAYRGPRNRLIARAEALTRHQ